MGSLSQATQPDTGSYATLMSRLVLKANDDYIFASMLLHSRQLAPQREQGLCSTHTLELTPSRGHARQTELLTASSSHSFSIMCVESTVTLAPHQQAE